MKISWQEVFRRLLQPQPALMIASLCLAFHTGSVVHAQVPGSFAPRVEEPVRKVGSEQRIALLIGNAKYPSSPLRNAVNDVESIGAALRRVGYTTITATDLSAKAMIDGLQFFSSRITSNASALFYYAGHGFEVAGRNFLLSTEADAPADDYIPTVALDLDLVLKRMDAARVKVAIIDACRLFRTGNRELERGLAPVTGPAGTYIAYSTAPNRPAKDGSGTLSPFAEALLGELEVPNRDLDAMFTAVRKRTLEITRGSQLPWSQNALTDAYFIAGAGPVGDPGGGSDASKEKSASARPTRYLPPGEIGFPAISAGDSWTYVTREHTDAPRIGTRDSTTIARIVDGVAETVDGLKFDRGWGRLNTVSAGRETAWFDPGIRGLPFPLFPGKRWAHKSKRTDDRGWYADLSYEGLIEGKEIIDVPAGRFEALRARVNWTYSNRNRDTGEGSMTVWYVPSLKRWAKMVYEERSSRYPSYREAWNLELMNSVLK